MNEAYAKFQNDRYKTVRGVMLTRGTHCLYIEGEKWLSSQCRKSDKKGTNTYIPNQVREKSRECHSHKPQPFPDTPAPFPNRMHILIPWRKHIQSFKTVGTEQ